MATTSTAPYALALHPFFTQQHLCRYRSKVCNSPRALKRDGSLHRYCEEHRQRANMNQKKWASRRMQVVDASDYHAVQLAYQQLYHSELTAASLQLAPVSMSLSASTACGNEASVPTPADAINTTDQNAPLLPAVDTDLTLDQLDLDGDELWSLLGLDVTPSQAVDGTTWVV